MKKWRYRIKCMVAVFLVMILGIQTFQGMNAIKVQAIATDVYNSTENRVLNGDFESGRDGYSVRSWSMTPMTIQREPATSIDTINAYLKSYELKTVVDQDGNKVAQLSKTGTGYMAMTSKEISVDAGKDYRMSFDYKVTELDINIDPKTGEPYTRGIDKYPIRFVIEEIDENKVRTFKHDQSMGDFSKQVHAEWNTYTMQFKTTATTRQVIIHCWFGEGANVKATVLFDNIQLEKHDDYAVINSSFEKTIHTSEGGRPEGNAGPAGWNLVSCAKGGTGTTSESYNEQFAATVEDIDDRDNVVAVTHLNHQTEGFSMLESSFIPIEAEQTCDIALDGKLVCRDINGDEVLSDARFKGMRIVLISYKEDKTVIKRQYGGWYHDTQNSNKNNVWEKISWTGIKTPENTKYIKICFYVGYNLDSDSTNIAAEDYNFTYYFDNIGLDVDDKSLGFTQYTSKNAGATGDIDFDRTPYYGIRKVNAGKGYEDAVQLYVTKETRSTNGVLFCRELSSVEENVQYRVDLDMKIEDVADSTKSTGADIVLRYLDAQKALLSTVALYNNDTNKQNMNWTYKTYSSTAPAGAKYVEIGLQIGINEANANPDMKHSFANIVIAEKDDTAFWDKYADTKTDPAVTSSSLYKQSALFVGESVGTGLAEQAISYSKMQVTNACSDTVAIEEQMEKSANSICDYIVVSGGMQEKAANIPAGEIKPDAFLDTGTSTFAGVMEYTLDKIAAYYNQRKIVFVLTTSDAAYCKVAVDAATKWGIQLVQLEDIADSFKNWQDIIEPAEQTNTMDYYQIPGVLEYLTKQVDDNAGTEASVSSNVNLLEAIKEKAQHCPDTNENYDKFQTLVNRIEDFLRDYQDFRPSICGGTIATNDPNVLSFIGLAPKKALTEGVTVKAMGILSIPTEYMNVESAQYKEDAALELENIHVKNMEVTYTEASKEFRVSQEAWDADPYTQYTATAYIVYEKNGENYTFYSNNDYVNAMGTHTAIDGRCTKSVFEISQTVALHLLSVKEMEMDFAAIGGEGNLSLVAQATEDSEVSLLDVYRLVCNNKNILKSWLDEGGASK